LIVLIYALLDYVRSNYNAKRFTLEISESTGLQFNNDGWKGVNFVTSAKIVQPSQ
jgi:hypothetical protein